MVYDIDNMLSIEIDMPIWSHAQFNEEENKKVLSCVVELINKTRDAAHISEFAAKQRVAIRYNSKVIPREVHDGDIILGQNKYNNYIACNLM